MRKRVTRAAPLFLPVALCGEKTPSLKENINSKQLTVVRPELVQRLKVRCPALRRPPEHAPHVARAAVVGRDHHRAVGCDGQGADCFVCVLTGFKVV